MFILQSSLQVVTTCLLLLVVKQLDCFETSASSSNSIILTFTTNATQVENRKPFLGVCKIDNFTDHAVHDYKVNYYRTKTLSKTLIATHELYAVQPHHLFVYVPPPGDDRIDVHSGVHLAYPLFEVVITPTNLERENYWCELEYSSPQKNTTTGSPNTTATTTSVRVVSNLFVNTPILELSIVQANGPTDQKDDYVANCNIKYYNPSGNQTYSVSFYMKDWLNSYFLGSYDFASNGSMEFTPRGNLISGLSNFRHGKRFSLPIFDLIYHTASTKPSERQSFYCELINGEDRDQPDYAQYFSNVIKHV